jgi:hypothetical protein
VQKPSHEKEEEKLIENVENQKIEPKIPDNQAVKDIDQNLKVTNSEPQKVVIPETITNEKTSEKAILNATELEKMIKLNSQFQRKL